MPEPARPKYGNVMCDLVAKYRRKTKLLMKILVFAVCCLLIGSPEASSGQSSSITGNFKTEALSILESEHREDDFSVRAVPELLGIAICSGKRQIVEIELDTNALLEDRGFMLGLLEGVAYHGDEGDINWLLDKMSHLDEEYRLGLTTFLIENLANVRRYDLAERVLSSLPRSISKTSREDAAVYAIRHSNHHAARKLFGDTSKDDEFESLLDSTVKSLARSTSERRGKTGLNGLDLAPHWRTALHGDYLIEPPKVTFQELKELSTGVTLREFAETAFFNIANLLVTGKATEANAMLNLFLSELKKSSKQLRRWEAEIACICKLKQDREFLVQTLALFDRIGHCTSHVSVACIELNHEDLAVDHLVSFESPPRSAVMRFVNSYFREEQENLLLSAEFGDRILRARVLTEASQAAVFKASLEKIE